jgi:hypothetical protein
VGRTGKEAYMLVIQRGRRTLGRSHTIWNEGKYAKDS